MSNTWGIKKGDLYICQYNDNHPRVCWSTSGPKTGVIAVYYSQEARDINSNHILLRKDDSCSFLVIAPKIDKITRDSHAISRLIGSVRHYGLFTICNKEETDSCLGWITDIQLNYFKSLK